MKTLFFALLLSLTAFAQSGRIEVVSDSLKMRVDSTGSLPGDTTYVRNFVGNYRWVYITYTDTGLTTAAGLTDSVYVYHSAGTDSSVWIQSPLYDPFNDEIKTFISNSGLTRTYLVYVPRPNWIKLWLSNSGGGRISGRMGRFVIRALNENY